MSFELQHLERSRIRLLAWLMHDALQESGVHDYVSEGYQKVSKACQIMTENEECEREQKDGARDEGLAACEGVVPDLQRVDTRELAPEG